MSVLGSWELNWNGLTVGGQRNPFRFASVPEGLGVPDADARVAGRAMGGSSWVQVGAGVARRLQFEIRVMGGDVGGLWSLVERAKGAFIDLGVDITGDMQIASGRRVSFTGRPTKCEVVEYVPSGATAVLAAEVVCGDPRLLGTPEIIDIVLESGDWPGRPYPRDYADDSGGLSPDYGASVPQVGGRVDLLNPGNTFSDWRVTFHGPVTDPVARDDTNGRQIQWIGTVASGEELVIDTYDRTITLDGANAYTDVDGIPDWWRVPGGDVVVIMDGTATDATSHAVFEWTPAYL